MKKLIMIAILLLVGCNETEQGRIEKAPIYRVFGNGYAMQCASYSWSHCGISLAQCADGMEYRCLQNVIVIK